MTSKRKPESFWKYKSDLTEEIQLIDACINCKSDWQIEPFTL